MNYIEKLYFVMKDMRDKIDQYQKMIEKANNEDARFLLQIKNTTMNAIELSKVGYAYSEFRKERRVLKTEYESLLTQYQVLGGDSKMEQLKKMSDIKNNETKKRLFVRKKDYYKNFNENQRERIEKCFHVV